MDPPFRTTHSPISISDDKRANEMQVQQCVCILTLGRKFVAQ